MARIEEEVARLLTEKGLKIVTAESTTGGYIGHLLNLVPGASKYFIGGVTAYTTKAKTSVLNVPASTIEQNGSVSAQTALAMAEGARLLLEADIGIGESGTAGPTGGSAERPRGTVFVAISAKDGYQLAERFLFDTDRMGFKERTAEAALDLVKHYLSRS